MVDWINPWPGGRSLQAGYQRWTHSSPLWGSTVW